MNSTITAISYAVPDGKLTHAELCSRFGTSVMDKVSKLSGILERRICADGECASDLAAQAAKRLFYTSGIGPDSIDLLLMATQTPDFAMPTTACILQDRLSISKSAACFDINLGCTQFIYAIATAQSWIASGLAKRALVLCADTPSKLINKMDRSAVSIFGDAACAILIEKSRLPSIIGFDFGSDGSGYDALICPCSGMRNPPSPPDAEEKRDADGNVRSNMNMKVDGLRIFAFAYKTIPESVSNLLNKRGLKVSNIDLFVFHQAGYKIVSDAAERLKIPRKKVYYKMHDIGNCGGASIGIALADAVSTGRLRPGMKVVCCAFGVGLSWGSALIEWSGNFRSASRVGDFSRSPEKPEQQRCADMI